MDAVPNWQGKHWEYGPEFLMKSGRNAASGWRLFEQTEWPQEKQSAVTSNQHARSEIQERKNTIPENNQREKAEETEERKVQLSKHCGEKAEKTPGSSLVQRGPMLQNNGAMHHIYRCGSSHVLC